MLLDQIKSRYYKSKTQEYLFFLIIIKCTSCEFFRQVKCRSCCFLKCYILPIHLTHSSSKTLHTLPPIYSTYQCCLLPHFFHLLLFHLLHNNEQARFHEDAGHFFHLMSLPRLVILNLYVVYSSCFLLSCRAVFLK